MLKTSKLVAASFWTLDSEAGRAWRFALSIFWWQRCALTLAGLLAAIFFHPDNTPHIYLLPPQVYAPTNGWEYFFTAPWQRWDSEEYLAIAYGGYGVHPALINFPPLYPALSGLLGRLLLGNYLLAALLVSNLAYIGALYFLYRLTAYRWDEKAARYTCLALACFPTAHFFLMAYSESLFLLLVLASFYYVSKNRWWLGCLMAAFAALTRLQGIVILLPLAYIYWEQHRPAPSANAKKKGGLVRLDKNVLALALVPFGIGLFELYASQVANSLGGLSKYWGIDVTWPGDTLLTALWKIAQPDKIFVPLYNLWGLFLLTLVSFTLWRGRHELPVSFQLFSWASILLYLTRKGEIITTVSLERYLILIFPAFIYVGVMLSRKKLFYHRRLLLFSIAFMLQWSLAFGFPFWFWTG